MRPLILLPLIGSLIGLGGCAQSPAEIARAADQQQAAQIKLDKALAGLQRGATTSCIPSIYPSAHTEAYGSTLLYRVSRSLVFRTDTAGGCENIARGDILVTKQLEGRPCRGDIATTVSPVSRTFTGSCSFGDFTEYRRR